MSERNLFAELKRPNVSISRYELRTARIYTDTAAHVRLLVRVNSAIRGHPITISRFEQFNCKKRESGVVVL